MSNDNKKAPQAGGGLPIPKMNRGLKGFYADVQREIKHINWPTPKETTRLTGVVLAVCGALALLLFGFSYVLEVAAKLIGIGGK